MSKINLANSTKEKPNFLQNIIKEKYPNFTIDKNLNIQITIPKETNVYIIDDLNKNIDISIEFIIKKNSTLNYQSILANNILKSINKELQFNLIENGAKALIEYKHLGNNNLLKIKTNQNHLASNTTSNLIIKCVLNENSKLFCNNTIYIDKKLQEIQAKQINKNLLLSSKNVQITSSPQLKVYSKEGKCKHGATISKLNKEHLFYLQSRGIKQEKAKDILVNAFLF